MEDSDLVNEENLKKQRFNFDNLVNNLEAINKSLPDPEPKPFLETMLEFVRIFNIMGSAMSIAFQGRVSSKTI